MNIILIGFKNSGKTSVGKLLAEKLTKNFVDTDQMIEAFYAVEQKEKLSVREIYAYQGEIYFRQLEKNIIARLDTQNSVIATGGGSILDPENVNCFKKNGKIIYLLVSFEELKKRFEKGAIPAFFNIEQNEQNYLEYYRSRKEIYKQVADIEIDTEGKTITDIVDELVPTCQ